MKTKKYKVFVKLVADGVWVQVNASNKEEANKLALETARMEICEGEANPSWKVQPSFTRLIE